MALVRQILPKVVSGVGFGSGSQVTGINNGDGTLTFGFSKCPMAVGGTIRGLAVYGGGARPGDVTVTVLAEGASTFLSAFLGTVETQASDGTHSVTVNRGDYVQYLIDGSTASLPGYDLGLCLEFDSTLMSFGIAAGAGTIGVGVSNETAAFGNGGNGGTFSICGIEAHVVGFTLRRFASQTGGAWKAQLLVDSVLQDGTSGTINTTSILDDADPPIRSFDFDCFVVPPQHVTVKLTRLGSEAAFAFEQCGIGIAVRPQVPGQTMICGGDNAIIPSDTDSTTWRWIQSAQEGAFEYMHTAPAGLRRFTATGLYVERSIAPGADTTFTHTLTKNSELTNLVVSFTGAVDRIGSDTGRVTYRSGDLLTLRIDNIGDVAGDSALNWTVAIGDVAVIGPLAWWHRPKRLTDGALITTVHSDWDMLCPAGWYDGYKEGMVLAFGDAERTLSDPVTGDWTGSTFRLTQSDTRRELLRELASQDHRYWVGNAPVYMTTRENRAQLGTAYCVFNGPIVDAQPNGLAVDFILGDAISRQLLSDQSQIPWRQHKDGFLSQLLEIAESLDREGPEPIAYGSHIRVPDVSPASPQGFIYTPTLLGKIDVAGDAWWVWEAFGHAIANIIDVYTIEPNTGSPTAPSSVLADEGTKWLVPHHAGYLAQFGVPYEDRRSDTYGNDRRYTLIYGKVGEADPDACADGSLTLAIAFEGIEPVGDGSGAYISDRFAQYAHFLINYVAHSGLDSYQTGHWLTNPTWEFPEGPLEVVEEDSFDACSDIAKERLPVVPGSPQLYPAGYIGAGIIGAHAGDQQSVTHWIAEWNKSCGVRFGVNHFGQLRICILHPTQAIKDAAPLLTDVHEILKDSFSTPIATDQQANLVPFVADFEHATGRWMTNDAASADESRANYDRTIPGATRQYLFAPGITQSYHLALMAVRELAHAPRGVILEGTVGPNADGESPGYLDLGDYFRYRHLASISDTAGSIRLAWVIKHQVQAGNRKVRIDAIDVDDLIDFDVLPDGSLGSPSVTNSACDDAIDMGDLSVEYDDIFDTSGNPTDLSVSGGSPSFGGPGVAYHAAWFKITGNIYDGVATFSTLGSDYDTQIVVYNGSCGALVPQGFNDNFGDLETSALDVDIVGGTDYYILVCGYGPDDGGFLHFRAVTDRSATAYRPQATITCPVGAVGIAAGSTTASRQTLINANPGASFCLAAGIHYATGSNAPTSNQKFFGEYGAVIDGTGWTRPESDLDASPFKAIANGVTGVEIRNLVIRNMPSYAVNAYLVSGWIIDHCDIDSCRTGICVGDDAQVTNNLIHDCVGNPGDVDPAKRGGGYSISQTDNVLFDSNNVYNNGTEQKFIGGTAGTNNTNFTVTNNKFHDNAGNGFWSDGYGAGGVVRYNFFWNNGANNIVIEKGKSVTVDQNTCEGAGELGVSFQSTRDSFITDNILRNNVSGIELFVDLDDVGTNGWSIDLRDNVVTGNQVTVPNDPGTSFAVTLGHVGAGSFAAYTSNTKNNNCDSNDYFVHSSGGNWWLWSSSIDWTGWQGVPQDAAGSRTVI